MYLLNISFFPPGSRLNRYINRYDPVVQAIKIWKVNAPSALLYKPDPNKSKYFSETEYLCQYGLFFS